MEEIMSDNPAVKQQKEIDPKQVPTSPSRTRNSTKLAAVGEISRAGAPTTSTKTGRRLRV
jgi:hypothetical protein